MANLPLLLCVCVCMCISPEPEPKLLLAEAFTFNSVALLQLGVAGSRTCRCSFGLTDKTSSALESHLKTAQEDFHTSWFVRLVSVVPVWAVD